MSRDARDIQRTWDGLVTGEMRQRNALKTIDDSRSPRDKSPVLVRLAWLGGSPLDPGRTVKFAGLLVNPEVDATAPFHGLTFIARAFAESEPIGSDYAITLGQILPAATAAGTLTTRTDDDTGTLTMADGGHGIATGASITLLWEGGSRSGVLVGTVSGTSVPIDGGTGHVLPATSTDVVVFLGGALGVGVLPEAYWAKVNVLAEEHTHATMSAGGTLLTSDTGGGLRILGKPAGTGEKWAVVSLINSEDRLVAADPTDGTPRELLGKLNNTGTYDPVLHDLVQAQLVPDFVGDPPDNKVRLFALKAEGTGTDHFRVFELIERKYSTESAATIRWLNHELAPNEAEEPETIADPMNLFAGAAAGYAPWSSEFTRGMRGVAARWNDRPKSISGTLSTRTDDDTGELTLSAMHGVMTGNTLDVYWNDGDNSRLGMTAGTVDVNDVPIDGGTGDNLPTATTAVVVVNQDAVLGDPLWKIVAMEGFAEWIKATVDFDDGEEIYQLTTSSTKEDHRWNHVIPVVTGGIVPLANDTQIYDPFDGDKVLALLDDPDTDPPTYRVFRGQGKDRRAISGKAYGPVATTDATFFIDNVVALDSGYNPTEGNTAALVTIVNFWAESYADNDDVWADFVKETGFWLARRKGGSGGGGVRLVRLVGVVNTATWSDAGEITPSVNSKSELTVNPSTGVTAIGDPMNVLWYGGDFTVPSGRERVGFAIPLKDHPELYVLIDPDCITFGE